MPKNSVVHTALNGAITFILMPFRTLATTILMGDVERFVAEGELIAHHHAFILLMGATIGIECHDEKSPEANILADFFTETQGKPTAEKWQLFCNLLSENALNVWWEAYIATRQKIDYPSAGDLQTGEPTDPN